MKLIDYLKRNDINYNEKNGKITVGGSLDLEGTQITSLPDNLSVGGSLDLRGTQITSLPDNLSVGGSLDLRGTQIDGVIYSKEIGSRNSITTYWTKGDKISCGCFTGTLNEFKRRVIEVYGKKSKHGREYLEFIKEIKTIKTTL